MVLGAVWLVDERPSVNEAEFVWGKLAPVRLLILLHARRRRWNAADLVCVSNSDPPGAMREGGVNNVWKCVRAAQAQQQ